MGTLYYTGSVLLATRNLPEFYSSIELTLTASITFNNHPYSSLLKQDRFVVLQTNICKIRKTITYAVYFGYLCIKNFELIRERKIKCS